MFFGSGVLLLLDDRADRVGNIDAFRAVAFSERFDEFMLDDALMIEPAGRQNDVEVDGGVPEICKAHGGVRIRIVVYACEHFFCRLDGDALDLSEIAVVGDADGDADVDAARGQAEIRDVCTCDGLVRDDDSVACADGDDGGETPRDIRDAPFFSCAELDIVAEAQLF